MQNIPSVDLRDFLSDDPKRKQKFVNEIGTAYEEIGFVALKGHFLNDELVENLYTEVRNFFSLPLEVKEKYEFIEIDILSCNIDELQNIIINELENVLYKNEIISNYSHRLKEILKISSLMSSIKNFFPKAILPIVKLYKDLKAN